MCFRIEVDPRESSLWSVRSYVFDELLFSFGCQFASGDSAFDGVEIIDYFFDDCVCGFVGDSWVIGGIVELLEGFRGVGFFVHNDEFVWLIGFFDDDGTVFLHLV